MAKRKQTYKVKLSQNKKKNLLIFGGAATILLAIIGVALYEKYAPHPYADLTVNPNDTNASVLDESLKAASADDYETAIETAKQFLALASSDLEKQAAYVNLLNVYLGKKDSNAAYDLALEVLDEDFESDRTIALEITTANALLAVNDYDAVKKVIARAEKLDDLEKVDEAQLENLSQIIDEGIKNQIFSNTVTILVTRINIAKEQKDDANLEKYYKAILKEISETEEDPELAGLRAQMQDEFDNLSEESEKRETDE